MCTGILAKFHHTCASDLLTVFKAILLCKDVDPKISGKRADIEPHKLHASDGTYRYHADCRRDTHCSTKRILQVVVYVYWCTVILLMTRKFANCEKKRECLIGLDTTSR
jgi:hypothetical protein